MTIATTNNPADLNITREVSFKTTRMTFSHSLLVIRALAGREIIKFLNQRGRLASALVRPMLWLLVFSAGFRNVLGISIIPPYETYTEYPVYMGARPDRYYPFISDDAVSIIDGLRPRDGPNASTANITYAALVFTICKGGGSSISFDPSGLHVFGDMSYFWSLASWGSLALYSAGNVRGCRNAWCCRFVVVSLR